MDRKDIGDSVYKFLTLTWLSSPMLVTSPFKHQTHFFKFFMKKKSFSWSQFSARKIIYPTEQTVCFAVCPLLLISNVCSSLFLFKTSALGHSYFGCLGCLSIILFGIWLLKLFNLYFLHIYQFLSFPVTLDPVFSHLFYLRRSRCCMIKKLKLKLPNWKLYETGLVLPVMAKNPI